MCNLHIIDKMMVLLFISTTSTSVSDDDWLVLRNSGLDRFKSGNSNVVLYYSHLQKTGGTLLCNLVQWYGLIGNVRENCNVQPGTYLLKDNVRQWRHMNASEHLAAVRQYKLRFVANEVQLPSQSLPSPDQLVYMTTIRPPLERLVSYYVQMHANSRINIDPEVFWTWAFRDSDAFYNNNHYTRYFSGLCTPHRLCSSIVALQHAAHRLHTHYSAALCMYSLHDEWDQWARERLGLVYNANATLRTYGRTPPARHQNGTLTLTRRIFGDVHGRMLALRKRNELDIILYTHIMLPLHRRSFPHSSECRAPHNGHDAFFRQLHGHN